MKFVFVINLLFIIVYTVSSQEKGVTIESNEISIQQAFNLIEVQTTYTIAFNQTKYDVNKKISLFIRNADIKDALSLILNNSGWTYLIEENHVLIIKEDEIKECKITQKLRGRIYDKLTGFPLPFASVIILDDPKKGVFSDESGHFEFTDLPIGRYDLKVLFMGYESFIYREVVLTSAKIPFVEIPLTVSLFQLNEIVIESQTNKDQTLNPMVFAGGRMFSVEETSRYAGGFDDPARLVTSFAGVAGGMGDNSVIVHGNAPHLLQWRLEGMEIGNPNHFADLTTMGGGIFSSLSSNVLGNSDFLTGAYPAEYNNAFSGIFDMKLRNGNNQRYESSLQTSLIGLDLASEGPLGKKGKASYLFNYRNATFAFIRKFIPDMEINNFGYQDLAFKLHLPAGKGIFSIWGLGLMDENYEKFNRYSSEWSSENSYKINLTGNQYMASGGIVHSYLCSDKISAKTSLGVVYSKNNLEPDSIQMLEIPNLNLLSRSFNVNAATQLNYKINARHINKSGITWTSMFYNFLYDEFVSSTEIIQGKIHGHTGTLSAFSNSLINLNEAIKVNIGINGQIFLLNKNRVLEPRLAIDYVLKQNHSIAFAYGLHSRLERLTTYFIEEENVFSNKKLDFIKSHQFVLSYKWKISESKIMKIEPYFHYLYNIPMISGTSYSSLNGLSFLINVPLANEGKGINKGVDLTFERHMSKGYYFLLTGSLFDSKYCGKDRHWFNTRYNYRFLFNFLGGKEWIFGNNKQHMLSANAKLMVSGGDRYTPVNEEESLLTGSLVTYNDKMYESQFNPKLKGDMTLNYALNQKSIVHEISFKILNITGIKEYYRHRYDPETGSIVKDEAKIILPNLSYKISF